MPNTNYLHMHVLGAGPAVLLLGGCPSPTEHLLPLAADLAATHQVFVPDLPGYGWSPAQGTPYSLAKAEALLVASLQSFGVRRAAVVGFSFGAWRALSLACHGELEVPAVVTLGGFASLDEAGQQGMAGFAAALRAGVDLHDVAGQRFLSPAFAAAQPAIAAQARTWIDAAPVEVLAAELEATVGLPDLLPLLPDLASYVAARVGELDPAAPPALSEALVAAARHGELAVVAHAGHALLYEDFAGTAAFVRRVLAEHP